MKAMLTVFLETMLSVFMEPMLTTNTYFVVCIIEPTQAKNNHYTVINGYLFSRPHTKLPLAGNYQIIPSQGEFFQ
jgi:hypothetical protein